MVMGRFAKVIYINETSGHDGYCSGNECEYKKETLTQYVVLPNKYKQYPLGMITNADEFEFSWATLIDTPDVGHGSGYCNLSHESREHGLELHDYCQTIVSVEIVEHDTEVVELPTGISVAGSSSPHVFLRVPNITTLERDRMTLEPGVIFFNTSTGRLNVYDGNEWKVVQTQ